MLKRSGSRIGRRGDARGETRYVEDTNLRKGGEHRSFAAASRHCSSSSTVAYSSSPLPTLNLVVKLKKACSRLLMTTLGMNPDGPVKTSLIDILSATSPSSVALPASPTSSVPCSAISPSPTVSFWSSRLPAWAIHAPRSPCSLSTGHTSHSFLLNPNTCVPDPVGECLEFIKRSARAPSLPVQ
ncbi:hypothetical protein KP509_23G031500 [Ceratopteris richardii]|uniref:Uncharacterized protein n=1 Tax=Ceratopteris richardii TaxID=49495 RepID=A0A8T2S0U5_CERRI|nr:hypothetical protein KP509_23G031500 [Ceratopteris richardii]